MLSDMLDGQRVIIDVPHGHGSLGGGLVFSAHASQENLQVELVQNGC